jgi:hypothetical protein
VAHSVQEFWRDEAKLGLLQAKWRWKTYLMAFEVIACGAWVVTVLNWLDTAKWPVLASVSLALAVFCPLAHIIYDMFWRAGEAGARLMDDRDALTATSRAPQSTQYDLPLLYLNLKVAVRNRLNAFASRDKVLSRDRDSAVESEKLQNYLGFRSDIQKLVDDANQQISAITLGGVVHFRCSDDANQHQFRHAVEKLLTRIDDYRSTVSAA